MDTDQENQKINHTSAIDYPGDGQITVKDLIKGTVKWYKYLLSKWVLIIGIGLLGSLLGLMYALNKKPIYIASTNFVLEDEGTGGAMGQFAGIASAFGLSSGGNSGGGIFQSDNMPELYKSRRMIEKALLTPIQGYKDGNLLNTYIRINHLRDAWAEKPATKNLNFNLAPGTALNRVQDSIMNNVVLDIDKNYLFVSKPDKLLSITEVKVKSGDEYFSKLFNERIVQTVNDFYVQTKSKKAVDNLKILQFQADSIRSAFNVAIAGSASALDANPNMNMARTSLRVPSQRRQLDVESSKAILVELVKNLELAKISLRKETPLIQIIDSPVFPLQKQKVGKAMGLIVGGLIGGFLTVIILVLRKVFRNILSE